VGKVGDLVASHLQIDGDGRAAELGMRGGAGVRLCETAKPRNIAGQFDDSAVVDVVEHAKSLRFTGLAT
jgi:hypothetical protein